jgi:hypothetical protein
MKKSIETMILAAAIGLLFIMTGCATCPKHSMELVTEGEHNGVLSVDGTVVTVYGSGSGRNPGAAGMMFDANHEQDSMERALPESKNELKNGIRRFFDSVADKYNNKYPDKKISGDTVAVWKTNADEKAVTDSKTFFYCYCADNYIATYIETYDINIAGLKLTPEDAEFFVSTAKSLIRPGSEESRVLAEQHAPAGITVPAQAAGAKNSDITGSLDSGANTGNSGANPAGPEPFWAKDMDGNSYDYKHGVVAVENDEITIFGGGIMARQPAISNDIAKSQAKRSFELIMENTISEYLRLYPSEKADCDMVKTASDAISGEIPSQSVLIGSWIKQEKILLSTLNTYYSLTVYKLNIDRLKLPQKMKDILILEGRKAVCPYAGDIVELIKHPQVAETAPSASDNALGIILASLAGLLAILIILAVAHSPSVY